MEFTASVEYVRLIMNYAPLSGFDSFRIYQKAGFDPSILEKAGARIPADQFNAIWEALEEINPDKNLGLHLGEKIFIFPGHILFLLMLNAPTIKDAIDKFCRYFNLLANFTSPCFSTEKSLAEMTIHFHSNEFSPTRHANEGILSAYASVLHRISEKKIHFDGVYFTHSQPEDISEHQRIFHAPLFFDQIENKLTFSNEYLALPVLLSNQNILETLEQLAKKLQERIYSCGPWSEKVSKLVMGMLQGEKTAIESISRKLAVSPRNLQNLLKKEGMTYQKLLDHVRKEQAMYFLENETLPISEIAHLLGYSEQSVFSRAFKRWVGFSPGQYRSKFK
ncbi:MAG: AraC family transcriptional regulator [Proteobacteria bacterium]|nr:AraC family transcriptional regulator [Pseudomonadota bacterium]